MEVLLLAVLCLVEVGFAESYTISGKGKIHIAKVSVQDCIRVIYRPENHQFSHWQEKAFMQIYSGDNEKDIRQKYSNQISTNASEALQMSWDTKGAHLWTYDRTKKPLPNQWYGYAVYIYNDTMLVYKDTGNVYQSASTLEECNSDDQAPSYDVTPRCSELLMDPRDRPVRMSHSETTTYHLHGAKSSKHSDNGRSHAFAAILAGILIPTGVIIICLVCCCCWYANKSSDNTGRNQRGSVDESGMASEMTTTTTIVDMDKDAPPSYDLVVNAN